MSQTASTDYASLDRSPSKRPDFVLAIAGHATLYSVADDSYTLSAGAHDLSSTNGFTTIRKWAGLPEISASKMKGAFPEAGGFDIGDLKVELLDKHGESTTTRDLSALLGRQAFLEGNQTGSEYELADDPLTKAATTINLVSTSGIVAGDVLHISQEAILVGTVASGTQLTGCTRGYLLTNATRHEVGVTVYGYLPNLVGRPIWLYKGYRDLALSAWLECWGGLITSPSRSAPGKVTIQARATTWAMWGGTAPAGGRMGSAHRPRFGSTGSGANAPAAGVRRIVRLGKIDDENNEETALTFAESYAFDGDYAVDIKTPFAYPSGLDDGHYMLNVSGYWFGIVSPFAVEIQTAEGSNARATLVKGLGGGAGNIPAISVGDQLDLGWSNATFSATAAAVGTDPIELMLGLLTSTGSGTNGAYDTYKKGIGLGIPVEQIDLDSFTNVQAQNDYDSAGMRVFFVFTESADAKEFVEEELCRPFGWYLATGNDGRISLVRPKNPDKLYISKANNTFTLTVSTHPTTAFSFQLPGGVYTPSEAVSALTTGLSAVTGKTFTVSWSSSTGLFTVAVSSGTFTFSASDSWATLGHTTASGDTSKVGSAAVALWVADDFNTVTKDDVIADSTQVIANGSARIGRVNFGCNYNWSEDRFDYKVFVDAEIENLSPFGDSQPYEINSKGLIRAFRGTRRIRTPLGYLRPPSSGCEGVSSDVDTSYGIDSSNSYAALFCSHLFDRYRNAPLRFKCRLKWKFNTREIGDVLSVTHDVDGALIDQERGTANVSARRFEIVGIRPVPASGCVEVELLGHRLGG